MYTSIVWSNSLVKVNLHIRLVDSHFDLQLVQQCMSRRTCRLPVWFSCPVFFHCPAFLQFFRRLVDEDVDEADTA